MHLDSETSCLGLNTSRLGLEPSAWVRRCPAWVQRFHVWVQVLRAWVQCGHEVSLAFSKVLAADRSEALVIKGNVKSKSLADLGRAQQPLSYEARSLDYMIFATLAFLSALGTNQGLLAYFADLSGPASRY